MLFTGEYEHNIDAKQRLAIPAEWRAQLDPEAHGRAFFAAPGANGSLWLWPERTFERMASAMEESLLPGEEAMAFQELLFPRSRRLEIDKAGRVHIPEAILQEYGLGPSVVLIGVKDHLELRDPAKWQAQRLESLGRHAEIMLRARAALDRHQRGGG